MTGIMAISFLKHDLKGHKTILTNLEEELKILKESGAALIEKIPPNKREEALNLLNQAEGLRERCIKSLNEDITRLEARLKSQVAALSEEEKLKLTEYEGAFND